MPPVALNKAVRHSVAGFALERGVHARAYALDALESETIERTVVLGAAFSSDFAFGAT